MNVAPRAPLSVSKGLKAPRRLFHVIYLALVKRRGRKSRSAGGLIGPRRRFCRWPAVRLGSALLGKAG